ncbi:MAG TPA: M14 family metallopeptidase [Vicinamibacterales bacterium]
MKRILLVVGVFLTLPLTDREPYRVDIAAQGAGPSIMTVTSLVTSAVRDTNGDGLADAVAARVILPAEPAAEEIEGAANLAARLGFETTGLSLPIVIRATELGARTAVDVPILVGRENPLVLKAAAQLGIDLKTLKPGQGLIAAVRAPLGGGDGLLLAGGDAAGTLAAANHLASRLPRAWGMSGVTLRMIDEQVAAYLKSRRIAADAAGVSSILVDSDRRGLAYVTVRAQVADGDVARAQRALADLDGAHRRGMEPRTLNYSDIAETIVELRVGDRIAGRASVRRSGLNSRTLTPPIEPGELAPDSPGDRGRPAESAPRGPGKRFDLTDVYSLAGWFGDAYVDLIPDRTETTILLGDGSDTFGASHIAARIGLESTGVTFPLVKPAAKVRDASREPSPILVGRTNQLVEDLVKIGKTSFDDLKPGEGAVHVVPRAFGETTATVVAGADAAGSEAAAMYLGRRTPYVWETARGSLTLSEVAEDVSRFLSARSGAGQASLALNALDDIAADLKDKKVRSMEVKLFLEKADRGLEAHLAGALTKQLGGTPVKVTTQGVTDPVPVFDETINVPWEVEEFWTKFRTDVLPRVKPGSSVDVEARLSESPEYRRTIADAVRAELTKAGAAQPRVRVLSAYKQGFLWLTEEVIPQLKGKRVASVRIKARELEPDLTKDYKFYQVPSRWLKELYPVDEIFERELGLSKDAFHLELVEEAKDIYTFEALDGGGTVVHRATFSPKFVEREYLDKFPGWSRVDVTTGWLSASVDGATVADVRIATDPERFWDHYQSKILPRIYDHVMKVTDNKPTPAKQPFHRDLDIEIHMSEPDFRIGVDEELVSSLESLHEDLYFVTLDFFDALGRTTTRQRLAGPGKIFPIVHPERRGKPGTVRVLYAGNAATAPRLEVSYVEEGVERPGRIARDLAKVDATPPAVLRAVVRADAVSELELQVEPKDDREAARAADALDALGRLHAAGLYRTTLSYSHVDQVAVNLVLRDARTRRVVRHTGTAAPSNVRTATAKPQHPIVAWDHVIGPDESEEIVGKLAAYPEVAAYKAGRSYRGREISVMELTLPTPSELASLAKLTTLKPTIFITGRQHANEVSSTSHILRLGELLVTDPAYKSILEDVNIILHPVENPDGAEMAFELQKLTPTHMLHAGRYSALGMDVASQVGLPDPLLPEARIRGRLWQEWLPDIYLNPHGYPSHEWVQQFAGYVPPGFRSYWSSRGWYTGVGGLRDPRYPDHMTGVEALREAIVREINSNADVKAMNLRHQSRYRRWAFGFAPYVFNQEIYKDTAIYYTDPETGEPRGRRRASGEGRGGRGMMAAWPQVTFVSGGTEAPDETAQGEWLTLVTKPGFSYLMAHVKYLRDGRYKVERIEEDGQRDATSLTLLRVRPVLPGTSRQSTATPPY